MKNQQKSLTFNICLTWTFIYSFRRPKITFDFYLGKWPDCKEPPTCQVMGMIGEYPNCHKRPSRSTCDGHTTGEYPNCQWLPCPSDYITKTGNLYCFFSIAFGLEIVPRLLSADYGWQ